MQEKWDQRYANSSSPGQCCWLLAEFSHLLPSQGRSLDLACGLGGNALYLAEQGLESHGWDISTVALDKLARFAASRQVIVHTRQQNVELNPPTPESFDLIIVSQFLHRPLCAHLSAALNPGGLLFYQTFNTNKLSSNGPSNSDYLLGKNELLSLFSPLNILLYREDGLAGDSRHGQGTMSYLIAQRSAQADENCKL